LYLRGAVLVFEKKRTSGGLYEIYKTHSSQAPRKLRPRVVQFAGWAREVKLKASLFSLLAELESAKEWELNAREYFNIDVRQKARGLFRIARAKY
jgi:hypothetical protein